LFTVIITRAVVSRDTIFQSLGLEGLKSRSPSRLGTLKSRKMVMSWPYLLFLLWNYFSIKIPNMPKESYFQGCLVMYNHWFQDAQWQESHKWIY